MSQLQLYWRLGRMIQESKQGQGYGARVVERLSADLRAAFPDMKGLSPRNLWYMRAFAEAWPEEMLQRTVAPLPWGHNIELLDRLDTVEERLWYAGRAIEHGWSRTVLAHQIMSKLHLRAGQATTNFERALPAPQSELMQQLTKDPYHLEFLGLAEQVSERTLEEALVSQVQRFLLELGQGFAFVGRQHHLDVDGEDFFIDLLFFHIPTKRYVVLELKRTEFTPEAIGKLNFYVNVVDDRLRRDGENPTIGLLLCTGRTESVVRYTLSGIATPRAVAGYRLTDLPPDALDAVPAERGLIAAVESALDDYRAHDPARRRERIGFPARRRLAAARLRGHGLRRPQAVRVTHGAGHSSRRRSRARPAPVAGAGHLDQPGARHRRRALRQVAGVRHPQPQAGSGG
jgi:predicted nuclease of restriction endonuclease-like (RecB) superfamily